MAYEYVIPRELTDRLKGLGCRIRSVALLVGVGRFLLAVCGLLVALMLADWFFDFEPTTRLVLLGILACVSFALAGWWLGRPWLRTIPDAELAAFAEQRFPQLGERLTSLVELADTSIPESQRGSPLMREMLELETVRCFAACDVEDAVGTQRAMHSLWGGLGATVTILLSLLLFPSFSGMLFARLLNPWGNFDSVGRLTFDVADGDRVVARGSDVVIVAKVAWRRGSDEPIPEPIALQIKSNSGESDSRELRFDPERSAFVATIPKVFDSFDFFVAADGNRSKKFRINVVDAPVVIAAKLEISPPGYVGEPRRDIDGVTGEIAVFERSQLRFQLTFNKLVRSAEIEWMSPQVVSGSVHDKSPKPADLADKKRISPSINELVSVEKLERTQLELSADGRSANVTLPAEIQAHFAFRLTDEHGLINDEPHRQFLVLLDQPPLLEVAGSPRDEAQPTDAYPLKVSVADDFGIGALELHVTSPKGLSKVIALATEKLNAPAFEHEFRIDLADLGVKVGDLLTMQVRTADERPVPAANEIWSPERTLAIRENAAAPGSREALERQSELRDELVAIRKELGDEAKQAAALEAAAQKDIASMQPFSQPADLKELAEREDQTSDRLQELAERFTEQPLFANLKAETERLAEQEVAQQAEQLKLAEKFETADIAGQLQDNSVAMQKAEQQVAAMERKFADLAKLERDLLEVGRLAQRANELADDAERLEARRDELANDKQLEGDREQDRKMARTELAREEGQLAKEQSDLLSELNKLLEKRPEIVQAARDHQLDRLAELAEQARQLAKTQDEITESFNVDVERNADAAQPALEKQREIAERTEQLAATIDAQQARTPFSPLDPEIARKLLDELEKGNLAAAEQLAKQSADDIDRAIAEPNAAVRSRSAAEALDRLVETLEPAEAVTSADPANSTPSRPNARERASAQLAEQLKVLAQEQRDLGREIGELTQDRQPVALSADQQRQRTQEAAALVQELNELSEQLGAAPIDLAEPSKRATQAGVSATHGKRAMQQAAVNQAAGKSNEAAQDSVRASDQLRQSAIEANDSQRPQPSNENPIPGNLANQLTSAAQRLNQLPSSIELLRKAAVDLNQALAQIKTDSPTPLNSQRRQANRQRSAASDSPTSNGTRSESPNETIETAVPKTPAQRHWGKLPGGLRTEILQSIQRKAGGNYSGFKKLYFDDLATDTN